MPDYIYLLENRLSADQQNALRQISRAAREAGMNVFLVGGAVRDLTIGSSVRDLDVAVQGNALKLKKPLEKLGGQLWGEHEASHTLFFHFPVSVRVEISSTRREEYPKAGKPVYHFDNILEDLRRRDFTANAMALSLNEHSYGLLMDPLNGVADIEARLLRLVSSYGFLEAPARLLRATRLAARLGWDLEERTKTRFQNAKEEGIISSLSPFSQGYELEEIAHEEDGLLILAAMEAEGWMHFLFPAWTASKADTAGIGEMHRLLTQLQMQGINPDPSAASAQLLTAKLQPQELTALKKSFVRPGFVEEWDKLDQVAKDFAKQLTGKEAATPSATWKLFTSANPQAVLWLGLTSTSAPVQAKYKNFFTVWPAARQKVPHLLMQELRITPELPEYTEMLNQLFLGTIDGRLETDEQLRAFLEPYSPPAPPPPVTVRRTRVSRKSAEGKGKSAAAVATQDPGQDPSDDEAKADDELDDKPEAVAPAAKKGKLEPAAKNSSAGKTEPAAAKRTPGLAASAHPSPHEKPASSGAHAKQSKTSPVAKPAKPAGQPTTKPHPPASAGKKAAPAKSVSAKPASHSSPKPAAAKSQPAHKKGHAAKAAAHAPAKTQKKPVIVKKSKHSKKH
jgi:tRNA nucleotidyltransferase (CCA-adding enzyme)